MKQDPNDIEVGVTEIAVAFFAAFGIGAFIVGTYALIWGNWYAFRVCATVIATAFFLIALIFFGGRQ